MRLEGVAFDFDDVHGFRRMVSRHLGMKINALTGAAAAQSGKPKSELARLDLEVIARSDSGGVNRVMVAVVITHLSPSVRSRQYSVTLSVPSACLTFRSEHYPFEVRSDVPGRRRFQGTEK